MPSDPAQILIVDDDEIARDELARQLSQRGYCVRVAVTATQIFDSARQRAVNVILLADRAAGGDGLELLRDLRKTWPRDHLAIIFMSDADDPATEIAALEANANDFVGKPVALSVLIARIDARLRVNALIESSKRAGQRQRARPDLPVRSCFARRACRRGCRR